jgi:hypothetical protein
LATLLTGWEGGATSSPASDRFSSRLFGIAETSDPFAVFEKSGSFTIPGQSASPNGFLATPPVAPAAPVPGHDGMTLLQAMITSVLALIALIALFRLTVGEEFFSSRRLRH